MTIDNERNMSGDENLSPTVCNSIEYKYNGNAFHLSYDIDMTKQLIDIWNIYFWRQENAFDISKQLYLDMISTQYGIGKKPFNIQIQVSYR